MSKNVTKKNILFSARVQTIRALPVIVRRTTIHRPTFWHRPRQNFFNCISEEINKFGHRRIGDRKLGDPLLTISRRKFSEKFMEVRNRKRRLSEPIPRLRWLRCRFRGLQVHIYSLESVCCQILASLKYLNDSAISEISFYVSSFTSFYRIFLEEC